MGLVSWDGSNVPWYVSFGWSFVTAGTASEATESNTDEQN